MKKRDAICDDKGVKKSKTVLESERREEGLQKSLDSTNKGFALLAKMGYKAGESLGKSKIGRTEPIPIEVKNNRTGLGRDAVIKEIKETKAKLRIQKSMKAISKVLSTEDFRAAQSMKVRGKRIEGDLFKSQKACRQLDLAKEFTLPIEPWFWPKNIQESTIVDEEEEGVKIREIIEAEEADDDEEEEEIEIPSEEMLRILTEYLRTEYLFCVWCGITFSDIEDLNSNCPGNTRESHDD